MSFLHILKQVRFGGPPRYTGERSEAERRHNEHRRRETDVVQPMRMRNNAAQTEERRARTRATQRRMAIEHQQLERQRAEGRSHPRGYGGAGRVWVRGYYRSVRGNRFWVAGHWENRRPGDPARGPDRQ